MNKQARKEMLISLLFNYFKSLELNRKNTAKVLDISTSTLDRMTKKGFGPESSKEEGAKNAKVTYAIDHIAEHQVNKITCKTI